MPFEVDLSLPAEGEWFPFQTSHLDKESGEWLFDPPDSDARVRVRSLQPFLDQRAAKRERVFEHVLNPKSRQMERISYLKEQSVSEIQRDMDDGWDYAITGLENFKDKRSGVTIERTRENVLALMRVPAFDRFIGRCMRILSGAEVEQREAAEKN